MTMYSQESLDTYTYPSDIWITVTVSQITYSWALLYNQTYRIVDSERLGV